MKGPTPGAPQHAVFVKLGLNPVTHESSTEIPSSWTATQVHENSAGHDRHSINSMSETSTESEHFTVFNWVLQNLQICGIVIEDVHAGIGAFSSQDLDS